MHAVVRRYTGVSSLIEQMSQRQGEVEELMAAVPGFNAYYAAHDHHGVRRQHRYGEVDRSRGAVGPRQPPAVDGKPAPGDRG